MQNAELSVKIEVPGTIIPVGLFGFPFSIFHF